MKQFLTLAALALTIPCMHAQRTDPNLLAAQQAQEAHDLPAAIRNYRAYLQGHPKSSEAHLNLSNVFIEQKDYASAIHELQLALPLVGKKQRPTVLIDIGLADIKANDIPAARQQFNAALEADPKSLLAAGLLANTDLHENDPEAALKDLGALGALADQNAELAAAYGDALIRTGKLHQGAMVLARVADAKDDSALFEEAGSAFLEDSEPDAARRALESAYRLDPQNPSIDTLVGIARILSADPFAAEPAFREALALQPDNFLANLYLGITLLSRRNAEASAKPFLDRAQQLPLPASKPLKQGGVFQTDSGSLDPAIALLKQIATKSPTSPEPHLQLAALYTRLNRTAEADAERRLAASLAKP
jgi:Tfp pilus assembly protein PilF